MASITPLATLLIFTVILSSVENAKTFINVQCKTENRAKYGQSSLLECVVKTAEDVADVQIRVVTWKKKGVEEPLLVFNRGKMKNQPHYSFAEPSWNDKNMNVSLLIANTALEDEGVYDCVVMTNSGGNINHTNLNVTAKYSVPTINSIPEKISQNTDGTLVCNSDGGYPQGQLRWFDVHGADWTKSADMEVKKTESGLFHLSSSLKLMRGSVFSKYTCVLFNASGGKQDEATLEIADDPDSLVQRAESSDGKLSQLLCTVQKEGSCFNSGLVSKSCRPPDGSERESECRFLSGLHGELPTKQEPGKGLDTASRIVAPVVVIGSLIAGLLLVLVLFYRRRHRQNRRQSATPLMGDHREVRTCESDVEGGDHQEMDTKCQDSLP